MRNMRKQQQNRADVRAAAAALGALGGKARGGEKARTARENGKLGGRPRKAKKGAAR
jgi:hypothetical protein